MHALHLGFAQRAIGSMMVQLCEERAFGEFKGKAVLRFEASLKVAYGLFVSWARARGLAHSQGLFTRGLFGLDDSIDGWPDFKGKASNSKTVCLWLADFLVQLGRRDEQEALFHGLRIMFELMHDSSHGPWLTEAAAAEFYTGGTLALTMFAALSRRARASGQPRWPIKPKMHQIDHMLTTVLTTSLNPAWWWSFADEDFNGKLVKLAFRHRHPLRFSERVAEKLQIAEFRRTQAAILLTEVKALKGPEQSFNYRVYPVVKGSNNHVEVLIKAVVPKGGFEKSDVMAARRNGYGRNGYGINISFYNFVCFRAMLLIYD